MKRSLSIVTILVLLSMSLAIVSFGEPTSLTDVVNQAQSEENGDSSNYDGSDDIGSDNYVDDEYYEDDYTDEYSNNQDSEDAQQETSGSKLNLSEEGSRPSKNNDFIAGLNNTADLTKPDVEGVSTVTSGLRTVAAFIVQVVAYLITAFMAVTVLLDLLYITIPFLRTFLANGYSGNVQRTGNTNNMMSGSMYGTGNMGMNGMGMNGYNRFSGGGMGNPAMYNARMNQEGIAAGNQRNSLMGQIQFVSDAALDAVITASTTPDQGKSPNPLKIYFKHMMIKLILTPVLIVLAATGVLTQLGFIIADAVVAVIGKIGAMI